MSEVRTLSYVWGSQEPARYIECNGHKKFVAPNLFAALRRLRFADKERVVWIDALCINQEDPDERSRQVLLMRDIYTKPSRVIVWLGEDREDVFAQEAIRRITNAEKCFYSELSKPLGEELDHSDLAKWDTVKHLPWDSSRINPYDLPSRTPGGINSEWVPVRWFYSLPWFRRVWVVQEVAFSPALVYIGDLEIKWNSVKIAIKWFLDRGYGESIDFTHALWVRDIELAHRISYLDNFAMMIMILRNSEATEPRDKVFALLGLLDDSTRANVLLQPDYSKRLVDVYVDAFRHMALGKASGKLLDLLGFTMQPPAEVDPGFPSWVPRLDKAQPRKLLHPSSLPQSPWMDWELTLVAQVTDKNLLILKGAKVATVKLVDHTCVRTLRMRTSLNLCWEEQ
jgi:hypothetical protein